MSLTKGGRSSGKGSGPVGRSMGQIKAFRRVYELPSSEDPAQDPRVRRLPGFGRGNRSGLGPGHEAHSHGCCDAMESVAGCVEAADGHETRFS